MEKSTTCPRCKTSAPTRLGRIFCPSCGYLIADMTPEGSRHSFLTLFTVACMQLVMYAAIAVVIVMVSLLAKDWIMTHTPIPDLVTFLSRVVFR